MNIEVLKSKLSKVEVTTSMINNDGVIIMDNDMIDTLSIVPNESVLVINERTGKRETLFVSGIDSDEYYLMMVPNSVAGVGETITVISKGRVTADEYFNEPIIINAQKEKEI